MVQLMHENPQFKNAVDVVVYYNTKEKIFVVGSTDKGCGGYYIHRNDLLGKDFCYPEKVMDAIIPKLSEDEEHIVLFTNLALNAVALIVTENRLK